MNINSEGIGATKMLEDAIDNAKKTFSINDLMANLIKTSLDRRNDPTGNANAITKFTKKTLVTSNAYIDDTLIHNDIMVPLLGTLNQIYISYILTALNIMNIENYKNISTMLGRIATENLEAYVNIDPVEFINERFGKGVNVSTEAMDTAKVYTVEDAVKHLVVGRLIEFEFNVDNFEVTNTYEKSSELDKDNNVEVRSGNKTSTKKASGTVKAFIYVQVFPVVLPKEVTDVFLSLNFPLSLRKRLLQVFTREIRFFRDFVMCMDLTEKFQKAIDKDKDNKLFDFYRKKSRKELKQVYGALSASKNNNLANSIIIMSKDVFMSASKNAHIDISKIGDKNRFFDASYAMMLVIVDEMYDTVDIYYNGLPNKSEVSFRAIKQVGTSKSGADITELMQAISKGSAPRF